MVRNNPTSKGTSGDQVLRHVIRVLIPQMAVCLGDQDTAARVAMEVGASWAAVFIHVPQSSQFEHECQFRAAVPGWLVFAVGKGMILDSAGPNFTSLAMLAECWFRRCP